MMRFSRNNRALLKICDRERGTQCCQPQPQNTHPSSCQHPELRTAASILQAQPCGTSRQALRLPTYGLCACAGARSPRPSGANCNPRCLCHHGRRNPLPSSHPPSHRAGQCPWPQRQPQAPAKSKPACTLPHRPRAPPYQPGPSPQAGCVHALGGVVGKSGPVLRAGEAGPGSPPLLTPPPASAAPTAAAKDGSSITTSSCQWPGARCLAALCRGRGHRLHPQGSGPTGVAEGSVEK